MKKDRHVFVCTECGEENLTWVGRCPYCQAWNSLKELTVADAAAAVTPSELPPLVSLATITTANQPDRVVSSMQEVDRVLGGGFFPGSVALLTGEPGIGKSTLLITLANAISGTQPVLYVSGEESTDQILQRAHRLSLSGANVRLAATTDLGQVLHILERETPRFVIIDSIQTIADSHVPSAAGSVVQVRESAMALQRWAKRSGSTLLLIGHVTKDGVVAGPRTLEHLVDVVLQLEGERTSDLRILRSQKNRYGPTDEVGILAMTSEGLTPVANPSARFLGERAVSVPGSMVTVILEGTRPLLVEIQALTRPTKNPYPRRTASGLDAGRLELLIAVLEARAHIKLSELDCYVNVSGGFRIREPGSDVAIMLAIASAASQKLLPQTSFAVGEVGLSGEVRSVPQMKRRIDEATRLGFTSQLSGRTILEIVKEADLFKKS